jgi:hypothetical protein
LLINIQTKLYDGVELTESTLYRDQVNRP